MKFQSILWPAVLASTALAAAAPPHSHPKLLASSESGPLEDRTLSKKDQVAAIRDAHFDSMRSRPHSRETTRTTGVDPPNTSSYSSNWAGADVVNPSGETFKSVTATMKLPTLTAPSTPEGPGDEYFLYVWVGIDGDGCSALWQTGFAGQIQNGVTSWWGWVCL
jgi:hypothetical protein